MRLRAGATAATLVLLLVACSETGDPAGAPSRTTSTSPADSGTKPTPSPTAEPSGAEESEPTQPLVVAVQARRAPLDLSDHDDEPLTGPLLRAATARIMAAITRELEVLRGESAPKTRFDARAAGLPPIGRFRPEDARPVPVPEPSTSGDNQTPVTPTAPDPGDRHGMDTTDEREERA